HEVMPPSIRNRGSESMSRRLHLHAIEIDFLILDSLTEVFIQGLPSVPQAIALVALVSIVEILPIRLRRSKNIIRVPAGASESIRAERRRYVEHLFDNRLIAQQRDCVFQGNFGCSLRFAHRRTSSWYSAARPNQAPGLVAPA